MSEKDQLQKNWEAFLKLQENMKAEDFGRTVLLLDGELVAVYNDSQDAYTIGVEKFGLGNFSIETFGEAPKSLGFFTTLVNGNGVAA